MIETEKKQERILLVGVELQGMNNFDMSMEELASLAKTAGGDVRGSYTSLKWSKQMRLRPWWSITA